MATSEMVIAQDEAPFKGVKRVSKVISLDPPQRKPCVWSDQIHLLNMLGNQAGTPSTAHV